MEPFNTFEKLQNLLHSIIEGNSIDNIANFILNNKLFDNSSNILSTLKLIASFAYSRPKLINQLVSLLTKIPKFKLDLYLVTMNFYDIITNNAIIQRIKILYLLLLRSHHINEKTYDKIIHHYNFHITEFLGFDLYIFQKVGFKSFFQFDKNTLIYQILVNDDIDFFQQYIALNNIDINEIVSFPNFEIYKQFQSSQLICYSAFFGSIRCFKFLLMNTNDIDYKSLLEYAIAGGNIDIVHISENESHDENITNNENLLYLAILFMNNDLIEYIVDCYNIKITPDCYIKCIYASNYSAFKKLIDLDNSFLYNERGANGLTPICVSSLEGYLDFFKFILTLDNIDYKKTDNDRWDILHLAIYAYNVEIVIYILKNKLINPFDENRYPNGPDIFNVFDGLIYNLEVLRWTKKIENEHLQKYKMYCWINNEIYNFGDEKDFVMKKRFYDKKFKQKRLNNDFLKKKKKKFHRKKAKKNLYMYMDEYLYH